ncbi:MAG: M23 family metallopeptidase [Deferribacteres bacterium]|nr:M23 family metallopeptidase [candidate division KSB1 bacterium]MCB9511752.1 M23 family metallopeptidase [Deferribacteres bacterium]
MKKNRPKRISVLFIPDDNAEPHSFRLSMRIVRVLMIVGIVLFMHMLAGIYAYWQWYHVHSDNRILTAKNDDLREDNKRVFYLQQRFEAINKDYQKVLNLLGVDGVKNPAMMVRDRQYSSSSELQNRGFDEDVYSGVQPDIEKISSQSSFVSRKNSSLHDFTPSLPTMLPVEGYLSADYSTTSWLLGSGDPGADKWHPGIDIAGRRGTDILAAGSGMVVFAGWTSRYGNIVIINHGNNVFTYYAHNSKLLVEDKAYVRKGEPIAQLGNSGYTSKGPHLHFEVWRDGKPVNPREYILAFHSSGS